MTRHLMGLGVAGLMLAAAAWSPRRALAQESPSAAVADTARPAADRSRDAARHPAALVAFAGVKAGDKVAELIPGGGYFTRILSKVVGPAGKVYTLQPVFPGRPDPLAAIKADPAYANVQPLSAGLMDFAAPEPLDVVWTSDNYHDFHNAMGGMKMDVAALDRAVFKALKPGGVFIVIDHASAPGAGTSVTSTLHRIDPNSVRAEVTAAGFVPDGESDVLRNPADPHTAKIFDPSIRGHTDQFVQRFRKPG